MIPPLAGVMVSAFSVSVSIGVYCAVVRHSNRARGWVREAQATLDRANVMHREATAMHDIVQRELAWVRLPHGGEIVIDFGEGRQGVVSVPVRPIQIAIPTLEADGFGQMVYRPTGEMDDMGREIYR